MKFPFKLEGWGTPGVALRRTPPPVNTVVPRPYRILYTRGEEVIEPSAYRGAFELALARGLPNTGSLSDDSTARAYAVSMTGYACTEYRAATVSTLPLEVLSGVQGADEPPLTGTPLDHFLGTAPNLLAEWTRSHLIFGRTYVRKRYNARGFPTGLQWLNPLDIYEYTQGSVVTGYRWTTPNGASEPLSLNEVIYSQAFDARPNGNGLSKFEAAWLALNIEASLSTFAAAFFVNGATPDGFLSFELPLSDEDFDEAVLVWKNTFKGAKNAHKTAALPGGARWNPITTAPKDLAMSELKGSEREDICAVFEVDPALVHLKDTGDPLSANSTYSAIEISHIRNVALPFARGVILSALNDQWALRDFQQPYRLDIDEAKIPALVEAQFVRSDTARNLTESGLLDYDEGRDLLGYAPRTGYLVRKADETLALWNAGMISLNDAHLMVSGDAPLGANGNVVLISGQLIPVDRLREVADANVEALKAPPGSPFGGLPPPPSGGITVSAPPPPQLPPGITDAQPRADDHSLCAMLYFQANDPALLSLQQRLRELYADRNVDWTPTDEFHVTVFHAPDASDVQAAQFAALLAALPVPDSLALTVGSLHSFDNVGEHALHFRIRRNADLLSYQERVFDAAQGVGILTSPYSAPDSYLPHVTMGKCDTPAKAVTYSGGLSVRPVTLRLMYGDVLAFERPLIGVENDATQRSQLLPLQLAIDLGGNTFVRYARRILSDALTTQGINAAWVDEGAWRLVLAQADAWTPSALATLIRSSDYTRAGKVDVRLDRFLEIDGVLYANITGPTAALENSARLDMQSCGLRAVVLEATEAEGIRLGLLDAPLSEGFSFPPVDFPIVLNTVGVYLGDERYHAWSLRAASPEQVRELANWQRVVTRKGRDYAFRAETLPQAVRDYLQVALADGDEVDTAFAEARTLLSETRAYADTEAMFIREVTDIIGSGQDGTFSVQKLGGQMRSIVRRAGLMALRDGFNTVGADPESFDQATLTAFRQWQETQSGLISNFVQEVTKQGISVEEVQLRAQMWANRTLESARELGISLAKPDALMMWVEGGTHDKCDDCLRLDKQVHPMSKWIASGWTPTSGRTACKSFNCLCQLKPTNQPESGNF